MSVLEQIRVAGIVGCGGAGFPTHVKYGTSAQYFIINAAECEPLLRTDRYLMKHEADKIIMAAQAVGEHLHAQEIVVATKNVYTEEIAAMEAAIEKAGSRVRIHQMTSFYPAGDEQAIVYEVTGAIVPPAGLPGEAGAVVSNVGTLYGVYEALEGRPFTHKYLTVTGAVEKPLIVKAPLGTSLAECIGAAVPPAAYSFIIGGPMMGRFKDQDKAETEVVTKTTSGIIVLPVDSGYEQRAQMPVSHMLQRARSACVQCSFCTEMCSRHMLGHPLRPHRIMRKLALSTETDRLLADEEIKQAYLCSECGICEEYACPMGLQPRRINGMLKSLLRREGISYEKKPLDLEADPMREYRKVPSRRLAARLGLEEYYHLKIDQLVELRPEKVSIPVRQHIGKPAQCVVSAGEQVLCGQLIAKCEDGALGADIHASIDGTVAAVGDKILIER